MRKFLSAQRTIELICHSGYCFPIGKQLTKIFYFSGTGNTLWSAKTIAAQIDGECELITIGIEAQKETITVEADAVVLLFPAYAYGPPLIVSSFVKKAVFKTPYIAVFTTFGTSPGGCLADVCRKLKSKNIPAVYFGRIPSVENYSAIFGEQKEATIQKRLTMQKDATADAAMSVMRRRTNRINTFRPFSAFVWLLFSLGVKFFYKWYRVTADCNGCGICKKLCPVSAITMCNGRPVFSCKCEHCQGCLHWCPRRAILFARVGSNTRRYHHPEIGMEELYTDGSSADDGS